MAKDKQKKKKERERKVAQKKLAAAAKRRTLDKSDSDGKKSGVGSTKLESTASPKSTFVATNKKSPFTQRRGGG